MVKPIDHAPDAVVADNRDPDFHCNFPDKFHNEHGLFIRARSLQFVKMALDGENLDDEIGCILQTFDRRIFLATALSPHGARELAKILNSYADEQEQKAKSTVNSFFQKPEGEQDA